VQQLRIHFTDSDIARTRIKLETDLLWEVVGSAQVLRLRDGDLTFGPWRRQVRELAGHDPELRMALHAMVSVAPHGVGGLLATRLHRALGVYFRSVIEPHLPMIADALCTDVAAGIQQYLHSGPEGLLGVLGPGTCCARPASSPRSATSSKPFHATWIDFRRQLSSREFDTPACRARGGTSRSLRA
jgi:hypothetical protein